MEKMLQVDFRNIETKEFLKETSLLEISSHFQQYFKYPILLARVNGVTEELSKNLTKKGTIDFYDRTSIIGRNVYARSVQFLLIVAIKKVLGNNVEVIIEHTIDKGIYCEIIGHEVNKNIISQIEEKMQEMVQENYIYVKFTVSRRDAIDYFTKKKQYDKVDVLKYISNTYVNLYRLDEYYDYFFGELVPSTSYVDSFNLTYIAENGFCLGLPTVFDPDAAKEYEHKEKIYESFMDAERFSSSLGVKTVADLNRIVSTGKYEDVIRLSEAYYNNQLIKIADEIYKNNKIKIILLAGPSSSGKTTTSKKLEIYLQVKGYKTHTISIDDYFINRDDTPLDENGEPDFEALNAIDVTTFNKDLTKLLAGDKVHIPTYNFVLGKREYKDHYLKLNEEDIIIIEGLHALNDELTASIADESKYKIAIAPLTQINIDYHNRIHTSDIRRLRRMVRDNKYRGYNASNTLKNWSKILRGEEKYIYPFEKNADAVINSALLYEIGVLKTFAEPLLFSVEANDENYPEAIRLINFLRNFLPIPSDGVPKDSLLREFIGGSCFHE